MDEPFLSKTKGLAEGSSKASSIKRELPSGNLDHGPSRRQSTAHLVRNDAIIPIITAPKPPSYLNIIANLKKGKLTRRSHSAPSVFTQFKEAFPDSLDPRPPLKSTPLIVQQAFIGLVLYILAGIVIYLTNGNFKGKATFKPVDALYFIVVTLCTIGYGDIVPDTTFTKLFTCVFILIGFGFVDILLNGLVTYICDRQEAVFLSTMDENSFYLSVTSVTTVGYGDYAFTTLTGRCFAIIWLLVSTLAVARAFLYLTELRIEKRNRRIAKWVLQKKMTLGDLVAADLDNDGSISKSEFVINKLKEMGKIAEKDILQICNQFDLIDDSKCGKITVADLMYSD
ncbi:hypothetical protein KPL71_012479 [Citrus sinensis]|uniref:Uncharacterized protein n=1 Tax=Citrus sinensis TaxID=2711 RepID=A0ACB8LBR1_CITSI|nr:hypothetical protein KPL71_012479 [Citrus sinensis]